MDNLVFCSEKIRDKYLILIFRIFHKLKYKRKINISQKKCTYESVFRLKFSLSKSVQYLQYKATMLS